MRAGTPRRSARSSSPTSARRWAIWKIADDCNWYINPTGKFVIGGPDGDAGLTGRKIIVDTYGGAAPHGGGAFSGKDTTKVDRSAAYAARYLAKNVVAAKLADRCTIQLAYAIGVAQPLSVYVDLHGTGKVEEASARGGLRKAMDLSPSGIRKHLDLNKPIYAKTSSYGHFGRKPGRDGSFSWEKTDLAKGLKDAPGRLTPGEPMIEGRRSRSTEAFFGRRRGKTMRPLQATALAEGLQRYRLDLAPAGAGGHQAAFPGRGLGRPAGDRLRRRRASAPRGGRPSRRRLHRRRALRQLRWRR